MVDHKGFRANLRQFRFEVQMPASSADPHLGNASERFQHVFPLVLVCNGPSILKIRDGLIATDTNHHVAILACRLEKGDVAAMEEVETARNHHLRANHNLKYIFAQTRSMQFDDFD